jgi:hypothetical protein
MGGYNWSTINICLCLQSTTQVCKNRKYLIIAVCEKDDCVYCAKSCPRQIETKTTVYCTNSCLQQTDLKGTVSRDFWPPGFFIKQSPLGPLIQGLKPFRIWLRNCWEIRDNHSKLSASAVSMRHGKPLPWFQWECGSGFRGFNETAEVAMAAFMRSKKRLGQFQWDRGIL